MATAPETRTFHPGDILSVLTQHMVSPRGIDGVRDLLAFMTSDQLDVHQYERAAAECRGSLAEQFPDLAAITIPAGALADRETGLDWLAGLAGGQRRTVAALRPEGHTHIDPVAESRARYGIGFRSHLAGGLPAGPGED